MKDQHVNQVAKKASRNRHSWFIFEDQMHRSEDLVWERCVEALVELKSGLLVHGLDSDQAACKEGVQDSTLGVSAFTPLG